MSVLDFLVTHTWWRYNAADSLHQIYHFFNLGEAVVWLVFGCLVLARFNRHRKSWLEVTYAFAFLLFGLTDLREAFVLQSWLILVKGMNLVALLWLRWIVIRRSYPTSKLY